MEKIEKTKKVDAATKYTKHAIKCMVLKSVEIKPSVKPSKFPYWFKRHKK